jgi:hypothetical protein
MRKLSNPLPIEMALLPCRGSRLGDALLITGLNRVALAGESSVAHSVCQQLESVVA